MFLPQPAFDIPAAEMHAKGQVTRVDHGPGVWARGFAAMNRTVLIRGRIERLSEKSGAEYSSKKAQQRVQARHWAASVLKAAKSKYRAAGERT